MVIGPGKYLVTMIWWIFAFFLLQLGRFSLWDYLSSYLVYFVAFIFTLAGAIVLNLMESRARFWSCRGRWGKYIILMTAYSVVIGVSLVATLVLDSYRLVAYFGGDAGGSFGLLYVPSVVFYWLAGAAWTASNR